MHLVASEKLIFCESNGHKNVCVSGMGDWSIAGPRFSGSVQKKVCFTWLWYCYSTDSADARVKCVSTKLTFLACNLTAHYCASRRRLFLSFRFSLSHLHSRILFLEAPRYAFIQCGRDTARSCAHSSCMKAAAHPSRRLFALLFAVLSLSLLLSPHGS